MNRTKIIFGAEMNEITSEHLSSFAHQPSHESVHFEAKSGVGFPDKIPHKTIETIVAFLNTSGGLLWIGAPQENWVDHDKRALGKQFQGDPRGHSLLSKDRIRNLLLSRIEPLPISVRISDPIKMADGQYSTIVEVEPSEYPPHQFEGQYFIRGEGETRRAPHGIVEALFYRRRGPSLEPDLELIDSEELVFKDGMLWLPLTLLLKNQGRAAAQEFRLDVTLENVRMIWSSSYIEGKHLPGFKHDGPSSKFHVSNREFPTGPVYPGTRSAGILKLNLPIAGYEFHVPVKITVNAIDMKTSVYEFDIHISEDIRIEKIRGQTVDGNPLLWPESPA